MTNGDQGGDTFPIKELVKIRKKESQKAQNYVGIYNSYYLDIKDGFLQNCKAVRDRILETLDLSQYDHIFVPPVNDQHTDHRETFFILFDMIKKMNKSIKIYMYEVTVPLTKPQCYTDLCEFFSNKLEAMYVFQSQLKTFDYTALISYLYKARGKKEVYQQVIL